MAFPKFNGRVIKTNNADYKEECSQYALSSYLDDGIIQPAAIIKAADETDVIKAINYARDNKIEHRRSSIQRRVIHKWK